jgi:hypothetical protein
MKIVIMITRLHFLSMSYNVDEKREGKEFVGGKTEGMLSWVRRKLYLVRYASLACRCSTLTHGESSFIDSNGRHGKAEARALTRTEIAQRELKAREVKTRKVVTSR